VLKWSASKNNQALMMGAAMVPQTSVIFNHLTRLIAREDFIIFNRHESFGSYRILVSEIDLNIHHLIITIFFRVFLKADIIVNKIILYILEHQ
jgi:hypothetical protein